MSSVNIRGTDTTRHARSVVSDGLQRPPHDHNTAKYQCSNHLIVQGTGRHRVSAILQLRAPSCAWLNHNAYLSDFVNAPSSLEDRYVVLAGVGPPLCVRVLALPHVDMRVNSAVLQANRTEAAGALGRSALERQTAIKVKESRHAARAVQREDPLDDELPHRSHLVAEFFA